MEPGATQILGRTVLALGLVLVAIGLGLTLAPRMPPWLGRLPGDLSWSRGNLRVFLPLGTCVLISAILTLVFSLISWLRR